MPNDAVAARRAALESFSAADLADLFRRVPEISGALSGQGPLCPQVVGRRRGRLPAAASTLAQLLTSTGTIVSTLFSCDGLELRLALLAAWHGGQLTAEQATAEAGADRAGDLDAAAEGLRRLVVARRDRAWLELLPGVADRLELPGIPARPFLQQETSDELARHLKALGIAKPPPRKHERVDRLEAALRDPDVIAAQLAAMPPDVREVFASLATGGPQPVTALGISYHVPRRRSYQLRRDTPLHWLEDRGMVGVDHRGQVAAVWLDVTVGLNGGRLFPGWPAPPAVSPAALADPGPFVPATVGLADRLLDRFAADPAPSLAAGGIGVRPVRAAAKALNADDRAVGLLTHLAVRLGLLGVTAPRRRGRSSQPAKEVWTPTSLATDFATRSPTERWALLVDTWRDDPIVEDLPDRVTVDAEPDLTRTAARVRLLTLLADLPPGTGLPADALAERALFAYPNVVDRDVVAGAVGALRVLGLVPADGPVGLTDMARALLDGPRRAAALLSPPTRRFAVQADHTVVAGPDLADDLSTELGRYADLESGAGAHVFRLSEARLAAAMEAGATAESIVSFLSEHAAAELPQNVAYLVEDVARRHGRLRTGEAGSYLRCDDPGLLTRAVQVKAAKLRLVAPTVAVSLLEPDRLAAALRARGLIPAVEDGGGVLTAATDRPQATPVWDAPQRLGKPRPAPSLDRLAKDVLDAPAADGELGWVPA
ncbi:MAG: helicase-associated domain-containing protein [Actinobacteria bacterium]|nr:helicase-associated domain-containing protein [Actinomycetota bacterium]